MEIPRAAVRVARAARVVREVRVCLVDGGAKVVRPGTTDMLRTIDGTQGGDGVLTSLYKKGVREILLP